MLVSLQSHNEVLSTLDAYPPLRLPWASNGIHTNGVQNGMNGHAREGRLFVASVSPQTRASLAAVFSVSEQEAGNMIAQLLSGPSGVRLGGNHGSDFTWVIDTNVVREACLVAAADEVATALAPGAPNAPPTPNSKGAADTTPKQPILTSACPGWICYAEKTHPYVLPHLSRLKSPQALTGTLIKSVLYRRYNIHPSQIFHVAIMPCFDKKLEASRSELTSQAWISSTEDAPVRDVDCVITARELLHLASSRNISFANLPRTPLPSSELNPFPDPKLNAFLFPSTRRKNNKHQSPAAGTSGGYLHHILSTYAAQNPGTKITSARGRNADVVEYSLVRGDETILRAARFYGFRNIQNLVRRLKPSKMSRMPGARGGVRRPSGAAGGEGMKEYAYVEVMACPGGCTNGGGQVKAGEVDEVREFEGVRVAEEKCTQEVVKVGVRDQKEWLAKVDEAYFSGEGSEEEEEDVVMGDAAETNGNGERMDGDVVNGISRSYIQDMVSHWSNITGVDTHKLLYTSYREVESDVGKKKKKQTDVERVAGLASSLGGGW